MAACTDYGIGINYTYDAFNTTYGDCIPSQDWEDVMQTKYLYEQMGVCSSGANYTPDQLDAWASEFPVLTKYPIFDPLTLNISENRTTTSSEQKDTHDKLIAYLDPHNYPCRQTIDNIYVDVEHTQTTSMGNVKYDDCTKNFVNDMTTPIYNSCPTERTFYDAFDKQSVTFDATDYMEQCKALLPQQPVDADTIPLPNGSCPYVRINTTTNAYYRVTDDTRNTCVLSNDYISGNDGIDPDLVVGAEYVPLSDGSCPSYRCSGTDNTGTSIPVDTDSLPVCKSDPTYIPGKDYIVPSCTDTTNGDGDDEDDGNDENGEDDGDDEDDGSDGGDTDNTNYTAIAVGGFALVCIAAAGGIIVYSLTRPSKSK
ncbi:MAG: hypothetical protein PHN45_00245 [Methylococcales bacterium]|nr:hypothetical protein [Methylococcales bacterium]